MGKECILKNLHILRKTFIIIFSPRTIRTIHDTKHVSGNVRYNGHVLLRASSHMRSTQSLVIIVWSLYVIWSSPTLGTDISRLYYVYVWSKIVTFPQLELQLHLRIYSTFCNETLELFLA